jgi:putative redox protein
MERRQPVNGAFHEVKVTLEEGMHFVAQADGEAFAIHLDAAAEHGGQGLGNSPVKMVLVGLAGCTAMDVISILRKKREEVTGLEVRVRGERAEEHPKVYTRIEVEFIVTGRGVNPASVERSIELSMERYCPVAGMLKSVVPITTSYQIVESG